MATRVNIPQPGLYVQMGASEEYPGGRIQHLMPGWVELDEELAKHPILSKLVPEDDTEMQRRFDLYEAEQERNEGVAEAQREFFEKSIEMDDERNEELRQKEEERGQRIEEDMKKGITRVEPHPDPIANWSMALTATPGDYMVPAVAMGSKMPDAQPPEPPSQTSSSAPSGSPSGTSASAVPVTPTGTVTNTGTVAGGTTDTTRATL